MACRQTPAMVDGMFDFSWPGGTLAAAAEDTGKRSPSMGQGFNSKLPDRERAAHRLHPLTGKIQPNRLGSCGDVRMGVVDHRLQLGSFWLNNLVPQRLTNGK